MRVRVKRSDDSRVDIIRPVLRKALGKTFSLATPKVMRLQKSARAGLRSPAWFPSGIVPELNASSADVLQLNFVCGLLSVEEIGQIRKPLVWRLSDMWAFDGAEHYTDDSENARWRRGYHSGNRPAGERGLDLDRWVWGRKRDAWHRPIHIVAPSKWLARCARESALMCDWPITVIPTTLDTAQFQPWPKTVARDVLGLPRETPLVLFGAVGGGSDPRKGRDFLPGALSRVCMQIPNVEAVIFGQSEPANPPDFGVPTHWMGHLDDDATLSLLYSAVDVMLIPSRQDNLPQTGVESQSCGCPVVTFNTSGLPDLVEDKKSGYLARPFDGADLAAGVTWVLSDPLRHAALSAHARARALGLWSPEVVIPQYLEVYEEAIASAASAA